MAADSLEADHEDAGDATAKLLPNGQAHGKSHGPPRHYPVDAVNTYGNLDNYEHRRITARDILVHRLISDVMSPSPETVSYHKQTTLYSVAPWDQENDLFYPYGSRAPFDTPPSKLAADFCILESLVFSSPILRKKVDVTKPFPTLHDRILHLVGRHYMESDDPALRVWVSRAKPPRMPPDSQNPDSSENTSHIDRRNKQRLLRLKLEHQRITGSKYISDEHAARLHSLQSRLERHDAYPLYDGGTSVALLRKYLDQEADKLHGPRRGMNDTHWTINNGAAISSRLPRWPEKFPPLPCAVQSRTLVNSNASSKFQIGGDNGRFKWPWNLFSDHGPRRSRHRLPELPPRRCRSEPRWGAWGGFMSAKFPEPCIHRKYEVYFPTMSLSEMDRRSRRRSLSRRRIEDMFTQKDRRGNLGPDEDSTRRPVCENCKDTRHTTMACRAPCGFCGAPGRFAFDEAWTAINDHHVERSEFDPESPGYHFNPHFAPTCPVAPENRCKCMPFPTFHTADRCSVPCRRDCGNKHSTGSFQHRNAMTCRSRCCMCGIRGHSGKECRQKRCRCGEAHLGQDCGWNPTCRIQGCDRYLCGVHCQDCGSLERPFVGKRCWKCLGFAEPIQHPETKSSRRRNKKLNNQNVDKNSGAQQEEVKTVVTTGLPSEDTTITTESTNPREEREEHQHQQQQQSIFGDPRGPGTNNRNK